MLLKEKCAFELPDDEELSIDIKFLREDAKMQVETFVSSRLEELAHEHSRPEIMEYVYELIAQESMPLHSLWFRGEMHDQIKLIATDTKCNELKRYLDVLVNSSFIRRTGDA